MPWMKITKNAWICEVERARYTGVRIGGVHKYTGKVTEILDRRWQKTFKKRLWCVCDMYTHILSKQVIIIHNGYSNSKAYIYFCFLPYIIYISLLLFCLVWGHWITLADFFWHAAVTTWDLSCATSPHSLQQKNSARIPWKVLQELLCSLKTAFVCFVL